MAKVRTIYDDMTYASNSQWNTLKCGNNTFTTTTSPLTNVTITDNNLIGHNTWGQHTYIPQGDWNTISPYDTTFVGYNQTIPIYEPFYCFASSEGRIHEAKRELVFKLLRSTNQPYDSIIKHLSMDEMLFNTLLMEYALEFAAKRFMELISRKPNFSKHDLYTQVILIYK